MTQPGTKDMMRRIAILLAISSTLSGCVTSRYTEPVGDFTKAMTTANSTVRAYFTGMNPLQRQIYVNSRLYDRTQPVGVPVGMPSVGMTPVFSAASINARLQAVSLLQAYGERLAALAGSDAPGRVRAGAEAIGTNADSLSQTFNALSSGQQPDTTAKAYAGPISSIVGVLGEAYVAKRRDARLRAAVNRAAPAVNTVLNQLEQDLKLVVDPLTTAGTSTMVRRATNYYDFNRTKLSDTDRRWILEDIKSLQDQADAAVAGDPAEAIDSIRDAHTALVDYANSRGTATDLATLVASIKEFNERIKVVAEAVQKLRS